MRTAAQQLRLAADWIELTNARVMFVSPDGSGVPHVRLCEFEDMRRLFAGQKTARTTHDSRYEHELICDDMRFTCMEWMPLDKTPPLPVDVVL